MQKCAQYKHTMISTRKCKNDVKMRKPNCIQTHMTSNAFSEEKRILHRTTKLGRKGSIRVWKPAEPAVLLRDAVQAMYVHPTALERRRIRLCLDLFRDYLPTEQP